LALETPVIVTRPSPGKKRGAAGGSGLPSANTWFDGSLAGPSPALL
jgi:hypothetical protein